MDSCPKAMPLGYSCRLRVRNGVCFIGMVEMLRSVEDQSRRWAAYNPIFTNSYVDVGIF
jgi:hypothetical protein